MPACERPLTTSEEPSLTSLAPAARRPAVAKVGHDLKAATIVLARHGLALAGQDMDTALASYLVDATRPTTPSNGLAIEEVGYRATAEEDVRGKGVKPLPSRSRAGGAPDLRLRAGGSRRSARAGPRRGLERGGLDGVYDELEKPLVPVLVDIEMAGVRVDAGPSANRAHGSRPSWTPGPSASMRSLANASTSTRRSSSATSCSPGCSSGR